MHLTTMHRPPQYWMSRYGLWGLGLSLALAGRPALAALGTAVLTCAGVAAFARAHGYRLPHAGYTRIVTYGCWDVPLAFAASRGSRSFLLRRTTDDPTAAVPDRYAVYALPPANSLEMLPYLDFRPGDLGPPLGHLPTSTLRFEGNGVATADLDRGLATLGSDVTRPAAGAREAA
jgi:hypothetical protein